MKQRESKCKSEDIMNTWTMAEMGLRKAKKSHKKDIRKQRRVLEKRQAEREVKESL